VASVPVSQSLSFPALQKSYRQRRAHIMISLAYVYGRETKADADIANVLRMDEARRIASNIAKLPNYLAANPESAN
jgi:hypothetical protein